MAEEQGKGGATPPTDGGSNTPPSDQQQSGGNAGANDQSGGTPGTPDPKDGAGSGEDPRVAQARSEAIEERKKRQDLETRLKELEDAKLTDEERRTARLSELEAAQAVSDQTAQDLRNDLALVSAAAKAGASSPEDVAKLVDRAGLKHGDDGRPTNADELVADVAKRIPAMFGKGSRGSADGGATGGSPNEKGADMEALLRTAAGH